MYKVPNILYIYTLVCVHVCTQFTHSYTPHTYLYTLPTYRCSHKLTCMHSHSFTPLHPGIPLHWGTETSKD